MGKKLVHGKTLRFVVLSDTHCLHDQLNVPPGYVLIHAGDFTNKGTIGMHNVVGSSSSSTADSIIQQAVASYVVSLVAAAVVVDDDTASQFHIGWWCRQLWSWSWSLLWCNLGINNNNNNNM
eukprot:GEZU01018033.1.p1 GENE.GEZU01018033.1~~GEZU01018033.1.p1  ORF type:complete len:122 (-),score=30.70 GEZU01018033.1:76-441(-)